jgi:alcohol dehydrogenase
VIIELVAPVYPEKVKEIGACMGLVVESDDPVKIGLAVANHLRAFQKELGVPTLEDLNISREGILGCTSYVANEGLRFLCPVEPTDQVITASLAKMYDGYQ